MTRNSQDKDSSGSWVISPARECFPAFAGEWDQLNSVLFGSHPMLDSRFIGPMLEFFADGSEMLCVHRTGGIADGALILRQRRRGIWASFLPGQAQIGPLLLSDGALLETLFGALPGFVWAIELLAVDPHFSPRWSGIRLPRSTTLHALTINIEPDGDFESYRSSLPKKLMSNLRRYEGRALQEGKACELSVATAVEEMSAGVARYGSVEAAGWKGGVGTAVTPTNSQGMFYSKVLESFARTGQALIFELRIGDDLAASRLGIANDHMAVALKTTYREDLSRFSPGWLVLFKCLQHLFEGHRVTSLELYTSASNVQMMWATDSRYIQHISLFRYQWAPLAISFARQLFRRSPATEAAPDDAERPGYRIHVRKDITELDEQETRLAIDSAKDCIEFTPDWLANLQQTVYGNDHGIRHLVAELLERPRAILPVRLTQRGRIKVVEALGNFYTSLFSPLPCSAKVADLECLITAASREHGTADEMRFAPLDEASPIFETTVCALRSAGWIPFRYFCFGNWYLKVDSDWKTYLSARSGVLRSTLKRMHKKFAEDQGTLEIITAADRAEAAIADFQSVYAASWKTPEPFPEFIPGLIRALARNGALRLGIARLGDRPVAAQIWRVHGSKADIFKLAYDAAFEHYSPGTLLTARLMEEVIDRDRVAEVDYLIGDDPYKQSWMSHRRERWGIVAYNPRTLVGAALASRELAARTMKKLMGTSRQE